MSTAQKNLLGIMDWGIGGLSIGRAVKSALGDVPFIYLSDSGATPYGKMSRNELTARLSGAIKFLRAQGVTHLVVACNAASTVIPFVEPTGMRIEGVIETAVVTTLRMRPARLALIGGRRTVLSGTYRKAFAEHGIKVQQRIAQPLSALIERGDVNSPDLLELCRRILAPVRNCSHLLIACTHYPAAMESLRKCVSASTVLIDPADELVKKIAKWKFSRGGPDVFFTTGHQGKMKQAALAAFGVRIKTARPAAFQ